MDRARSLGVGVGDPVSLRFGDGEPTTLRVVATYASNLGFGEFVLPRELVAAHVSVPMDARMLVDYADGADATALDAELAALAEHTPACAWWTGRRCGRQTPSRLASTAG